MLRAFPKTHFIKGNVDIEGLKFTFSFSLKNTDQPVFFLIKFLNATVLVTNQNLHLEHKQKDSDFHLEIPSTVPQKLQYRHVTNKSCLRLLRKTSSNILPLFSSGIVEVDTLSTDVRKAS